MRAVNGKHNLYEKLGAAKIIFALESMRDEVEKSLWHS